MIKRFNDTLHPGLSPRIFDGPAFPKKGKSRIGTCFSSMLFEGMMQPFHPAQATRYAELQAGSCISPVLHFSALAFSAGVFHGCASQLLSSLLHPDRAKTPACREAVLAGLDCSKPQRSVRRVTAKP